MKITRKEIRRMILEQVKEPASGPFFVVAQDEYEADVYIVKILPDDDWWFSPEDADLEDEHAAPGFGLMEGRDHRVTIFDMSRRKIQEFPGAPAAFIKFDVLKVL